MQEVSIIKYKDQICYTYSQWDAIPIKKEGILAKRLKKIGFKRIGGIFGRCKIVDLTQAKLYLLRDYRDK